MVFVYLENIIPIFGTNEVKLMTKLEILKTYLELHENASEWLDSVPHQIRTSFFDNPYCNALSSIIEMMLPEVFSSDLVELVWWYLYERGGDNTIEDNGIKYTINTIDDLISYTVQHYDEFKEYDNAAARTFRGR